jgi:hypothetical protein
MTRASHEPNAATISGPLSCLEEFGERLSGAMLRCTPCPSCDGTVMLLVERSAEDEAGADDPSSWIVTLVPGGRMSLEAVVDETRLEMLAIGPADRILALLRVLAEPVKVNA